MVWTSTWFSSGNGQGTACERASNGDVVSPTTARNNLLPGFVYICAGPKARPVADLNSYRGGG